jgi:hypothetical protein
MEAYASRSLSFSVYSDSVLISGSLPRLEGEAVMAAVEAWAEKLRSADDHIPAAARRADGLVALVNAASASGAIPSRGGLPVSLTVILESTAAGDPVWSTGRGHALTAAEQRFVACSADVTPLLVKPHSRRDATGRILSSGPHAPADPAAVAREADPAARVEALAATLLDSLVPLALGRTQRSATVAQRRAMAARDSGCIIPDCQVPAEACQAHHLVEWASGGSTDVDSMVLLCWSHHRQVDLGMWTIRPAGDRPPVAGGWPAAGSSPWVVEPTPRNRWRW